MGIQIKGDFQRAIKDFADLKMHIRRNAEDGLDRALDKSVDELKALLTQFVNEKITVKTPTADNQDEAGGPIANVPKAKNDLIKYIFEQDLSKADINKSNSKYKTTNDNSNVFAVKDKRIKVWQDLADSSTYQGEEARVKYRLINGIFVDPNTGAVYKANPGDIRGIKLECSRTEGGTIDSDKKFEAYKNSQKIKREKEGGQRLAVWTIRQADVELMMRNAVSIDAILQKIMEGDHQTAVNLLNQINTDGSLNKPIEKIKNIKLNRELTPSLAAYNDILKLIKNLKIEKRVMKTLTKYILFSNYGDEAESNSVFFEEMRKQVFLWITSNEEFWITAMVKAIENALQKYDSKAKFV